MLASWGVIISMKNKSSLIFVAYSEAFIATLPYVSLMAIGDLLSGFIESKEVTSISLSLNILFPFILLISITAQLTKRYNISQFIPISTSLAIFMCVETALYGLNSKYILSSEASFLVLIIPILVIKLLFLFTPENQRYFNISSELNISIKYIYSATFVFIVVTAFLVLMSSYLGEKLANIHTITSVHDDVLLTLRLFINHLLWFIGLHGTNIFDTLFGADFLARPIFSTLDYKQYYDLFVILGGSGAGLSLLLSIYIAGKDKHTHKVSRLATPFVIFNINEILIFGLPIIFNKKLLLPFIFVPFINLAISYIFLSIYSIEIVNPNIPWTMPIFINAYLATGGDFYAIGLQLLLLIIGTFIYIPFIRSYSATQSFHMQSERLSSKLDIKRQLHGSRELKSHKALVEIIQSNFQVDKIINLLSNENLMVFYQPKVNIKDNLCDQYEALLRIKMPDGTVKGPFFLDQLEIAGLASIIDIWVCQQVREHIQRWEDKGLNIKVSVNLHPDTLADGEALSQVISILSGMNVDFEIIERGLLDAVSAIKNINLLKRNGFSITVDDFGTGFSSFQVLCSLPLSCLKIDKSLIDLIHTEKGFIVCKHIAELCEDMGYACVAEGVETDEQYKILSSLNVRYIQGFYYSPAFSADKVASYRPNS